MSTTGDSPNQNVASRLTPNCTKTVAKVERDPMTGEIHGIPIFITVDQIQTFGLVPEGIEAVVLKADRGRFLIYPVE